MDFPVKSFTDPSFRALGDFLFHVHKKIPDGQAVLI